MDCIQKTAHWINKQCEGKDILEVGSMDEEKRLRSLIAPQCPNLYHGIDIHDGINVDSVISAENLTDIFEPNTYDIIVSTTVLEHVKDWKAAVSGMKNICKIGGCIVLSVPSEFPYHKDPEDYWRFSTTDISYIFSDFNIDKLEEDNIDDVADAYIKGARGRMVIIKAIKPQDFKEIDLSDYNVRPIK